MVWKAICLYGGIQHCRLTELRGAHLDLSIKIVLLLLDMIFQLPQAMLQCTREFVLQVDSSLLSVSMADQQATEVG